ncbi:TPA: hypothetical protein ACGAD2_004393 [Salmonella enterica subsp. enterica serovar Newport]
MLLVLWRGAALSFPAIDIASRQPVRRPCPCDEVIFSQRPFLCFFSSDGDYFFCRESDSAWQLLAHPPGSAEPAGAVSGFRYGLMAEHPGRAASVTGCAAPVAPVKIPGAPCIPAVNQPGCKAQRLTALTFTASLLPPTSAACSPLPDFPGAEITTSRFCRPGGDVPATKLFACGKNFCVRPRTAAP